MINLNYLTTISLLFLWLLLFLARNNLIQERLIETNMVEVVPLIEESKFMLPFVLRNYFMQIIDWTSIITSSLFAASFWYNNTEKKEEKEIKRNKQIGFLRQKYTGLCYSFVVLTAFVIIWHFFSRLELGFQFKPEIIKWLGEKINSFFWLWLGIDALSLPFLLLISFIMPLVFLSNWTTVDKDDGYYAPLVSLLQWLLLTVFVVIDLILFYVFFESILPPLFVMIGLYGAAQKFRAGYYLFLYTLLGSLFMLLVFVKMGGDTATTYFEGFNVVNIYSILQEIIWVILFVSFSVKTPLVPVHIWLPLAHSDANVSGSIILASIVLKLALYGFIRILIGIFTFATSRLIPFFFGLCSLSVMYSSVTTVRQFDLKVLVAYSSIAHMASSLLGTFSDTLYGIVGSIIFGLAHGFVSPGLFIIVGAILYDRCGSRIINYYRGLSNLLPFFALLFLLFVFGNMGVPLTGNFIGEFLSLLGAYQQNIFIASIGATSVILSAVYSIFMYNRVTGGSLSPFVHTIPDIFRKEFYIILPLLVLTLILGIYPCFISYDVEFGLSNYLLFTIFPAVLSDRADDGHSSNNSGSGSDDLKKSYSSSSDDQKSESDDQKKSDSSDDETKKSDDQKNKSEEEGKESDGDNNGPNDQSDSDSSGGGYPKGNDGNDGDDEWSSSDSESDSDKSTSGEPDSDSRSEAGSQTSSSSTDSTEAVYGDDENPEMSDSDNPDSQNNPGNPDNPYNPDKSDKSNNSDNEGNCHNNSDNESNYTNNSDNERNNSNISDGSNSSSGISGDLSDVNPSSSDTQPSESEGENHGNSAVHPNHNDTQPGQQFPPNIVPPNTPETGVVVPPTLNIPTEIIPNHYSDSESSDTDSQSGKDENKKNYGEQARDSKWDDEKGAESDGNVSDDNGSVKNENEENNEKENSEKNNGKNSGESNEKSNGGNSEGHNGNKNSNQLNQSYHKEIEENGNLTKGKDEWEPIGFIFSEYDWLTQWVKVMSKINNLINELMGLSLEIGFNNITSYLLILLLFFRLYLGYSNSMIMCLHYFKFKFILLKEKLHSFSSKFLKNK
jgi:NADH-ubiquinone oxidoreductase chain 4